MVESSYNPEFFSSHRAGSSNSAERLVPLIRGLVSARSVVDVGCGIGTWLRAFMQHGVEDPLGIDGPWVRPDQLLIPRERFVVADLATKIPVDRSFDLAISLEVAEHLPPASAGLFVSSLTRLAPVVVFSAAIPGQGGTDHVNEQWPGYWADRFAAARFVAIDCLRARVWHDPAVQWWYAQNTIVYASAEGLDRNPALRDARIASLPVDPHPLSLVHPLCLRTHLDQPYGLRRILRDLPGALRSAALPWTKHR